jgi:ureidoacrylate peracid hydrolase
LPLFLREDRCNLLRRLVLPAATQDLQLKKHGIHQLIVIAHTCVESTVRFGAELGYQATMVRDATASYSDEEMHASLDVNIPYYASAIVNTEEIAAAVGSLK